MAIVSLSVLSIVELTQYVSYQFQITQKNAERLFQVHNSILELSATLQVPHSIDVGRHSTGLRYLKIDVFGDQFVELLLP